MNYAGTYSVNIEPVRFTGNFEYRLFDEEGQLDNESDEMKTECYVYYTNGENRNDPTIQIKDMVYGNRYSISTSARTNSLYSFTGWCIVKYDDEGNEISSEEITGATNRDLSFTFGQGVFTDNFTVYARYDYNACNFNFILGDGIEQIVLSNRSEPITTTDTTVPLLKQLTSITDKIVNYGFEPEIMGRINKIRYLNPMTKEILIDILKSPKGRLGIMKKTFKSLGINFQIEPDLINFIAEEALIDNKGARSLNRIVDDLIDEEFTNAIINNKKNIKIKKKEFKK